MGPEMKQGRSADQPDPDDPRGPGETEGLFDVIGRIANGDRWDEVKERNRQLSEIQLVEAQRKARLERLGYSLGVVFLACVCAVMLAGTVWIIQAIFG